MIWWHGKERRCCWLLTSVVSLVGTAEVVALGQGWAPIGLVGLHLGCLLGKLGLPLACLWATTPKIRVLLDPPDNTIQLNSLFQHSRHDFRRQQRVSNNTSIIIHQW